MHVSLLKRSAIMAIIIGGLAAGVTMPASAVTGDLLSNGSFDSGSTGAGWMTTDPVGIECWVYATMSSYTNWTQNQSGYEGPNFAELNASRAGTLYQDVPTTPGETLTWSLAHRARGGNTTTDVMRVLAGPGAGSGSSGLTQLSSSTKDGVALTTTSLSDTGAAWGVWQGSYVVPAGQTLTRFAFEAVSSGGGSTSYGNFLDAISFGKLYFGSTYNVSYDAQGGTVTPTSDTYAGSPLTWPTPTRTGYTFNGWYDSNTGGTRQDTSGTTYTPSSSSTYYAQWSGVTVTYDAQGGTVTPTSDTYAGSPLTWPTPTRTGYTFNGWYDSNTGGTRQDTSGTTYTPSSSTTYYAQWSGVTVTYDAQGGTVTPTSDTYAGSPLTWPTPTRTGYTFNGWYDSNTGGTRQDTSGTTYTPSSSTTYYAQWSVVTPGPGPDDNSENSSSTDAHKQSLPNTGLSALGIVAIGCGGVSLGGVLMFLRLRKQAR